MRQAGDAANKRVFLNVLCKKLLNMKRSILVLMQVMAAMLTGYAQVGAWTGELEVQGMKLPMVFHLDDENPTLDSPAQGVKGIPSNVIRHSPDSISVNIPAIGASFTGKYENDRITGTFTQRGFRFPLTLAPGEYIMQRPQTPQPPFPYSREETSFSNGDAVLKGTLTLPESYGRETPVVIMVTGSGLQNRDEEISGHKPFAVIADALARNGIASLRYDDRGFGESTGDAVNCTTEDLMQDALSGIRLLRQKFNKVGVLGHSEGGTIALMLAADNDADFIVSLAGMVVSGKETLLDQNKLFLSQAGYPQQTIDEYCRLLSLAFEGDESLLQQLETSTLPAELKQNLQSGMVQLKSQYMQYFLNTDMREKLEKISCPVLALNGKKDSQVSYEKNLYALTEGLPSNNLNRTYALDNLNHLFQHCSTGSVNEYATIEETISPEVPEIICQWINSLR